MPPINPRFTLAVLLISGGVAFGCGARTTPVSYAELQQSDPRRHPYVIGSADMLRVTVWKDPNLSTEAPVRPDGTVTVPLVGDVQASGRTTAQVQKEIAKRMEGFVKDAVVTVAVLEVNSYRFTVAGNVEHPGVFAEKNYVTVSEAVALAGGPNRYASAGDVVVIRAQSGQQLRIPVDYEKILAGRDPEQDIVIVRGDTVYVP
jgi:polysaccharide export outer membrane protein